MSKTVKKIKKTDLSITILLVIGITIVINFFSYQLFFRWDLTENNVYSISSVSKNTVGNLDDIVSIKAYFSDDLPSQLISIRQEVEDILEEYSAFSNGNVRVEYIDPKDDEETQRSLYMKGIPQLQFNVVEKDKAQVVNGYMGIEIAYEDNSEVIPAVTSDTRDLEYQLTTAIKKVTIDEMGVVAFLTSHGTANLNSDITAAQSVLAELYSIKEVQFTEESYDIPSDVNTLVIVGPTEQFSDEQKQALNSFMVRGGSLLVLLDGVNVNIEQGLMATKNTTGLDDLLSKYGVKVNQDLIGDARAGMISYRQGTFPISITVQYPLWPRVTSEGFNKENNVVANLHDVVFPWASSVEVNENMLNMDEVSFIAFTSEKAWTMTDNFDTNPNTLIPGTNAGIKNLAVSINGGIKDAYSTESDKYVSGRLAVVGDGDFINDGFLRSNPENLTLFQNLVDSLSMDSDLISIRSKIASSRPIKQDLEDNDRMMIRYLNVFGVTVLVIIFGLSRYFLRRRSRFVDQF